jgi:hypothetical protein
MPRHLDAAVIDPRIAGDGAPGGDSDDCVVQPSRLACHADAEHCQVPPLRGADCVGVSPGPLGDRQSVVADLAVRASPLERPGALPCDLGVLEEERAISKGPVEVEAVVRVARLPIGDGCGREDLSIRLDETQGHNANDV